MSTNAERQRRYRRHKAGDHAICLPSTCDKAGAAPKPDRPAAEASSERGPRGAQLWRDMAESMPGPAQRVLLDQACRIADRLDRIDAMLNGREDWMRLQSAGDQIVVMVDNLLAEERQQANALRGIFAELRQAAPSKGRIAVPSTTSGAGSVPKPSGGGLSDLSARIAARRGASTG